MRALPIGVVLVDSRRAQSSLPTRRPGTIFGSIRARDRHCTSSKSIPNVELERRIADALQGEASVAPLTLTSAHGQRTYRVSVYPLGRRRRTRGGSSSLPTIKRRSCALDRARKEFLSNVSHELRTPLSSIKLMLETVLESPDDEARDLFFPQVLARSIA